MPGSPLARVWISGEFSVASHRSGFLWNKFYHYLRTSACWFTTTGPHWIRKAVLNPPTLNYKSTHSGQILVASFTLFIFICTSKAPPSPRRKSTNTVQFRTLNWSSGSALPVTNWISSILESAKLKSLQLRFANNKSASVPHQMGFLTGFCLIWHIIFSSFAMSTIGTVALNSVR